MNLVLTPIEEVLFYKPVYRAFRGTKLFSLEVATSNIQALRLHVVSLFIKVDLGARLKILINKRTFRNTQT